MDSLNVNEKRFKDSLFVFFSSVALMIYGLTEFIHLLIPGNKYPLHAGAVVFIVGFCIFYASMEILKEAFPCPEEEEQEDSQ